MESVLPILASLLSGGSLLTFVLGLLQRHDAQLLRMREEDRRQRESARIYELAFRRADAWGRQLVQIAGPVALADREGQEDVAEALSGVLAAFLVQEAAGRRQLRPYPDFLAEARQELELVEGSGKD